ncbi:MAG: hypothetical protein ACO1OC_09995 [Tuberibacillus sp.]
MTINAHIMPLIEDNIHENPLYRTLEIYMQRLGYLVPFREQLNWTAKIDVVTLGEEHELNALKKMAAKNDRKLLFYAKLTRQTIYQHIVCHPNDSGVYLPFKFDSPFTVNDQNQKLWLGSAPRLLEELKWMEMSLKSSGNDDIIAYWEQFQSAAQKAIDSMSPFLLKKES